MSASDPNLRCFSILSDLKMRDEGPVYDILQSNDLVRQLYFAVSRHVFPKERKNLLLNLLCSLRLKTNSVFHKNFNSMKSATDADFASFENGLFRCYLVGAFGALVMCLCVHRTH